jgi:hypothetical protein
MVRFFKFIYHKLLRPSRLRIEAAAINKLPGKTVLDIGYFDSYLKNLLREDIEYFGIDPEPAEQIKNMPKIKIEDFKTNKKFDIILAFEMLEHLTDPVSIIKKIKNMANRYICISLPYEPNYTLFRFFIPEVEHFWTIHPNVLEHYLGKPIFERKIHCNRNYFAIYEKRKSKNN